MAFFMTCFMVNFNQIPINLNQIPTVIFKNLSLSCLICGILMSQWIFQGVESIYAFKNAF